MVLQQARFLAFGLRLPPCRSIHVFAANPTFSVFSTGHSLHSSSTTTAPPGRSRPAATAPAAAVQAAKYNSRGSSPRRRYRSWWGMTLSGSRLGATEAARSAPLLPQQLQRGMFLLTRAGLTSKPGTGIAEEEEISGRSDGENGGDDLLAALAEELVWKGGDDEEEEDDDEEEMETMDIESFGISMMDDESAEEVQRQLNREWGTVSMENEQTDYEVDTAQLQAKLRQAMEVLGCQSWDVGAVLTTDKEVSRLNRQYRGMTKSTDILSFPNNDLSGNPGVLPKVRFPAEMDLGDMYISLAYVDRQISRDREEKTAAAAAEAGAEDAGSQGEERGGGEEREWWDGERGVSGAMSRVFDVQERASMLLVHGLIHLLGYDHETEEDYRAMVEVEEEVLRTVFGKGGGGGGGDTAVASK